MDYRKHVNTRHTAQTERTPGRNEVKNSAGGFVYAVDDWARLDRFLILGTDGGTYYVNESKLTKASGEVVLRCIQNDGPKTVERIVDVSTDARAHKNDAALFALAMAAKLGDANTRRKAFGVLPLVARTGTHLFQFVHYCEGFGGWGRGMRRAVANWYNEKSADKLAYQLLKYRQRDGWSHRDLMRLAHPVTSDETKRALFDVTTHPDKRLALLPTLPRIFTGFDSAQTMPQPNAELVRNFGLSWEMLPTEWLNDVEVNRELLKTMPLMATIRQLGKLTANGTIGPMSAETDRVIARLLDEEVIGKSRIHPMHYLLAAKAYAAGSGHRGSLKWHPDGRITEALNDGFYKAFRNVEPTGKRFLLGVDVSGSMHWNYAGNTSVTCAEAAGAMALVIAKTEPVHYIHGFSGNFVDLGITPRMTLDQAMKKVGNRNFGSTDCALPMVHALKNKIHVDVFVVITDNETWAGSIKPVDALRNYRDKINPEARLMVMAMTPSHFSIADPSDGGMLDVVGFDASVPQLLAEFAK